MADLQSFAGKLLWSALYMAVFAALLVGYLWDFFKFKKGLTILMLSGYCVLATMLDLFVAARFGYGPEEQAVYFFVICIAPYFFFRLLTKIPAAKYLYCLGSVSIQAFFIVGVLEYFHISQSALITLPYAESAGCIALLAGLDALIITLFRRYAAPLFREYQCGEAWGKMIFSPISGAIALGLYYFLTNFESGGIENIVIFTACYIALSIADIAAMSSIRVSIRATAAEARLESTNRILASQKEQYKRLSDSIAQTRQARHDLRHHMNAIAGFL